MGGGKPIPPFIFFASNLSFVRLGFLINPIAGMGGTVGLKGTDGMHIRAGELGAKALAPKRGSEFISAIDTETDILTASSPMGANIMGDIKHRVVYHCKKDTTASDTRDAARAFEDEGADLIAFCGGDGTARDILESTGQRVPVIGIPCGVKMHSSVFALNPGCAAEIVRAYAAKRAGIQDAEVMDVDEDAYRDGRLVSKLYGMVKTPYERGMIQASKQVFTGFDAERSKSDIAWFAKEFIMRDRSYILGAGSTTKAIADALGVEKTLLGVDVISCGSLIIKDASEKDLINHLSLNPNAKIIVTPIGAQGFVFGRGTQQISPRVIRMAGVKNIIYVATPQKLSGLERLLVDTGDAGLDSELSGYKSIVIGYRLAQKRRIEAP